MRLSFIVHLRVPTALEKMQRLPRALSAPIYPSSPGVHHAAFSLTSTPGPFSHFPSHAMFLCLPYSHSSLLQTSKFYLFWK